jgi:hypothetical protein
MCRPRDFGAYGTTRRAYDDYDDHTQRAPTTVTFMVVYQTSASIGNGVPSLDTRMRMWSETVELELDDAGEVPDVHRAVTAALFRKYGNQCSVGDVFIILNAIPNHYTGR